MLVETVNHLFTASVLHQMIGQSVDVAVLLRIANNLEAALEHTLIVEVVAPRLHHPQRAVGYRLRLVALSDPALQLLREVVTRRVNHQTAVVAAIVEVLL